MRNINYAFNPVGTLPMDKVLELDFMPVNTSDVDRMVSLVYAPHAKTKLPCSDLQVLFSDSVPPEVADWVRKNLQGQVAMSPSSIVNGEQVDDDTLIALTRQVGESDIDYINRCDNLIRSFNNKSEGD